MKIDIFHIYYADVEFHDSKGYKHRPALIIEYNNRPSVKALKLTGKEHCKMYHNFYDIQDYIQAGLSKPTIISLDEMYDIQKSSISNSVGELSDADLSQLLKKIKDIGGFDAIRRNTKRLTDDLEISDILNLLME